MKLDHVAFEVQDPGRSLDFYELLLRLQLVRALEFRAGEAPFPSLRLEDGPLIDLLPPRLWRGPLAANAHHLALRTTRERFEELRGRLDAQKVRIARTVDQNFGAEGFGRSIYFEDPDGIVVEVRTYGSPK